MSKRYTLSEKTAAGVNALVNSTPGLPTHFGVQNDFPGVPPTGPVYFELIEPLEACKSAEAKRVRLVDPECLEFEVISPEYKVKVYDIQSEVRRWGLEQMEGQSGTPPASVPAGTRIQCIQDAASDEITPGKRDYAFWRVHSIMSCKECSSDSSQGESSGSSGISEGSSASSEAPPPSEGSSKSSAIVPASWTPGGYAALFITEMPDVRFEEVMTYTGPQEYACVPIDPRYLEVCEVDTMAVVSACPDEPVVVGAKFCEDHVELKFADPAPDQVVTVTMRLTAIRKGFKHDRFTPRSERQFICNELFINSAYPAD
jgi:hypothetical protein